MPGNYGQQLNPGANAMHIYNGAPSMNVDLNGGTKTPLDDSYYNEEPVAQPKGVYAYSSTLPQQAFDNRAPQQGGMMRGDRFGTGLLYQPTNDEQQPLDEPFELPNPNAAGVQWPTSRPLSPPTNVNTLASRSHSQSRQPAVQLDDAIELLASGNDTVRSHAAAYIQHLLFRDENAKTRCRLLNGVPRLIRLVETGSLDTVRAGLGVLLNVSTGRTNDENKRAIIAANGLDVLLALLASPQESADVHELVTGVLWNVATCRDARRPLLERAVQPLVDYVVKAHAEHAFQLLQQVRVLSAELRQSADGGQQAQRTSELRLANQQVWSIVLRNATGALRCLSAEGDAARRKLRETRYIISSLLVLVRLAIETREFASDRDNKVIENSVCVLRNLSYALQELSDPTYTRRRRDEEALLHASAAAPRSNAPVAASDDQETISCFRTTAKKAPESNSSRQNLLPPANMHANDDVSQLWNAETVQLYEAILAECCNPQTIEAAAGALQNLTACEWLPSVEIRAQLRKDKALPILVDLLNLNTDNIVLATVLCLRNLVIDQRNKELIGKHALAQLAGKLPLDERDVQVDQRSRYCTVNDLSQATLAAILAAIHEVIILPSKQELAEANRLRKKLDQNTRLQNNEDDFLAANIKQANPAFARALLDCGCMPRLFFVVRSSLENTASARPLFDTKVMRFAQAVLYQLWLYTELRPEYLRRGWIERDFLPPTSRQPNGNGTITTFAQPNLMSQLNRQTTQPLPNSTMNRPSQSTLGATMRSQPARRAVPPSGPPTRAPTLSRAPPSLANASYQNTLRNGVLHPPQNPSMAGTLHSQRAFPNGGLQRSVDDIDLNASYTPDVRVPPAANRQPSQSGTIPRPLGSTPRNLTMSQGTLPGAKTEPTYTRVDKRNGAGSQANFDNHSMARSQNGGYSSNMQLVPRRVAQGAAADDPVADSWV